MMKRTSLSALTLLLLAGGCIETVSAEKFLYLYRRSAPPGTLEARGWYVRYYKDAQYHFLDVRYSTLDSSAMELIMWGGFHDETVRCPRKDLPSDFPEEFLMLYQEGKSDETEEQTRKYIRRYLDVYSDRPRTPPPRRLPTQPPAIPPPTISLAPSELECVP